MMIIGYSFRQNPTGRDCSAEQVRQNVFQAAIHDSALSTQDDFIYLINLKAFDAMTKMELIKKNVQEKPVGMQIINRLITKGQITQQATETDKRSKIIQITAKAVAALQQPIDNPASDVSGHR